MSFHRDRRSVLQPQWSFGRDRGLRSAVPDWWPAEVTHVVTRSPALQVEPDCAARRPKNAASVSNLCQRALTTDLSQTYMGITRPIARNHGYANPQAKTECATKVRRRNCISCVHPTGDFSTISDQRRARVRSIMAARYQTTCLRAPLRFLAGPAHDCFGSDADDPRRLLHPLNSDDLERRPNYPRRARCGHYKHDALLGLSRLDRASALQRGIIVPRCRSADKSR
jgi:hypothetical protein